MNRWLRSVFPQTSLFTQSRLGVKDHRALGEWGERMAARYLQRAGFRLVMRNFTAPVGHRRDGRLVTGEIDIIAYDESTAIPVLAFVEVKTRSSDAIATPEAAVDRRKRRQIVRTAQIYRRLLRVWDEPYRYDVLTILARPGEKAELTLRRGYFDDAGAGRRSGREAPGPV